MEYFGSISRIRSLLQRDNADTEKLPTKSPLSIQPNLFIPNPTSFDKRFAQFLPSIIIEQE